MIKSSHIYKNSGSNEVLRDISPEIESGEKLVNVGSSGSGKSITVRYMNVSAVQPISAYGCLA